MYRTSLSTVAFLLWMLMALPAVAQQKKPAGKKKGVKKEVKKPAAVKKPAPKVTEVKKPLVSKAVYTPPPTPKPDTAVVYYRDNIFSTAEIDRMKAFLITNASKPAQPKTKLWSPSYSLVCINTVRAGLEYLLYQQSSIPDSLFSRHEAFNCFTRTNRIDILMQQLKDSGLVCQMQTVGFSGLNRRKIVFIDSLKSYLEPYELDGSLWYTLRGMIGNVRGWSVFTVSLCAGTHAAILSVDHRDPDKMLVYWSDQTHNHPVIAGGKATLQYGWELMNEKGSIKTIPRGLDAYALHAMKTFWCDCSYDKKDKNAKVGACFPELIIWRIGRGQI
ncbi:hypothetical protein [uncultured Chitinophaga sp.]|uniref:hypothetical protein n=1 Tax=uncultured Chitinophaga sp. TaxID=339340 RepID=UPI0025E0ABA3|nr:hypothetical protein [uncultured Chitinophaga sp.]